MTPGDPRPSSWPPSPRRHRLPPLTSLRAFEAVARHHSIRLAAEDLAVTPAAISQQLRLLEDVLGTPLLRKQGRSVTLTEAGRMLAPGLQAAFDSMAEALALLQPAEGRPVIRLSVAPSFADKWLVPRLGRFITTHPEWDVEVLSSMALTSFAGDDGADIAIRFGSGDYPGLTVEHLLEEEVFPVCAPALLEGPQPLTCPADLCHHLLIHDANPAEQGACPDWPMWLAAAGVACATGTTGPRFNQSSLVLEAAAHGLGVALARGTLAAGDLERGRLVRPFAGNHALRFAYYIVTPAASLKRPELQAFRDWLRAEGNARPEQVSPRSSSP